MNDTSRCEYCTRTIKDDPVLKTIKGKQHIYCSEFCYRLLFYNAPAITYDDMQKMYAFYCVSLPADEYHRTLKRLTVEEG